MRSICNTNNSRQRIAFSGLEAAEGLIARTATPAAWIIQNPGSTVTARQKR